MAGGKKKEVSKPIASQDGVISIEQNLPYQHVYYPGFYGSYFAFSETSNSETIFCSCSKKSIENYIRLRIEIKSRENSNQLKNYILSISDFPLKIVEELYKKKNYSGPEIIDQLKFKETICHECNKQTPKYAYCHPMYAEAFEQNYGWYINKQSYEFGIKPVCFKILPDLCPDEVFELLDIGKSDFLSMYNSLNIDELIMLQAHDNLFKKSTRKIRNFLENEVRIRFGFKKIGDAWTNETLLYQLICELFPEEIIYRHYRPEFLEFLELDIFITNLNIGIEYQGIQHFEPIKHWGGEDALKKTQKRDKRKKVLCEKNKIRLIYFYYYEDLNKELIKEKIFDT